MKELKDTQWNACETGSLVTAKKSNQRTQLTRSLARMSLVGSLIVGCIVFATISLEIGGLPYKGGLTCKRMREWAVAYQSESGLNSQQRAQAKRHLADCPLCRSYFASLKKQTASLDRVYFLSHRQPSLFEVPKSQFKRKASQGSWPVPIRRAADRKLP